jgi:CheY-like chemotaxis protein
MPKPNGHDLARRMRRQGWPKDMVRIVLTGWGQEDDRRRTPEAAFDQHPVKPGTLDALRRRFLPAPRPPTCTRLSTKFAVHLPTRRPTRTSA